MAITQTKMYAVDHNSGSASTTYITTNNSTTLDTNIISASQADIDTLNGKIISYNNGQFVYLSSNNATIGSLNGTDISYSNGRIDNVSSDYITAGTINTDDAKIAKAIIDALNSTTINTEYLNVTKSAHFFELIVDKLKSIEGTIIQTAANCVIDYVKAYDGPNSEVDIDDPNASFYEIFWRAIDGNGKKTKNNWRQYDQAICQTFNVTQGTSYNVQNKYYWRLVEDKLSDAYLHSITKEVTTDASIAAYDKVDITIPIISYFNDAGIGADTCGWTCTTIGNATWTGTFVLPTDTGYIHTYNIGDGISLIPTFDNSVVPIKISFDSTLSRLNVNIFYSDGTSQYFPASVDASDTYEYDLTADNNITKVDITNAEAVGWKLMHRIYLSNDTCDVDATKGNSLPSEGDNIAQLGFRYNMLQSPTQADIQRASAIIIAAYGTPDTQVSPPSYAQYRNIIDFSLSSHRETYFDAKEAKFYGNFYIKNNNTYIAIEDYVNSTVSNMRNDTDNYFNFAYCQFDDCVPFIQGYGVEVKGTGTLSGRIRNLGFNGQGGDISVTCQMKMQATQDTITIDINDTDPQTVSVTTEWTPFQFVFNDIAVTHSTQQALFEAGFIDFVGTNITSSNRLYVKDLMIVRGNIPNGFNSSWKDYQSQDNAVMIGADEWLYTNMTKQNSEHKGYQVYSYNGTSIAANAFLDVITLHDKSGFVNGSYTLSFYGRKTTNTADNILRQSFLYDDAQSPTITIDGTIVPVDSPLASSASPFGNTSVGNNADCRTDFKFNQQWQRYIIHWYNNSGQTSRDVIGLRLQNESTSLSVIPTSFEIAGMELRKGYWSESSMNSQSMIRQTAYEIEMKVNDTGINIEDGLITISSDNTTIIGDIELHTGDQGLRIYDQNNAERISIMPDTIGALTGSPTLYSYNTGAYIYDTDTKQAIYNSSNAYYEVNNFNTLNLGQATQGGAIELSITVKANSTRMPASIDYSYTLKIDNVTEATSSGTSYKTNKGYNIPFTTRNASRAGAITLDVTISRLSNTQYTIKARSQARVSNLNKIGIDGAAFAYDNDDFNYLGATQTVIRHDLSQLSIDTNGIFNDGKDIGSYARVKTIPTSNTTYSPTLQEGILIWTGSSALTINLLAPTDCPGKIYYIKSLMNNITITTSGGTVIIPSNSTTDTNTLSVGVNSTILISANGRWIQF